MLLFFRTTDPCFFFDLPRRQTQGSRWWGHPPPACLSLPSSSLGRDVVALRATKMYLTSPTPPLMASSPPPLSLSFAVVLRRPVSPVCFCSNFNFFHHHSSFLFFPVPNVSNVPLRLISFFATSLFFLNHAPGRNVFTFSLFQQLLFPIVCVFNPSQLFFSVPIRVLPPTLFRFFGPTIERRASSASLRKKLWFP